MRESGETEICLSIMLRLGLNKPGLLLLVLTFIGVLILRDDKEKGDKYGKQVFKRSKNFI